MAETERIIETEVDDNALRQHLARYEFAKPIVEGRSILDVACGTGYGTFFLSTTCKRGITGVDVSAEAVDYAKAHYQRPGLSYECGDALSLEPYVGVEAVTSLETIEHLQDPESFLKQVVKVLSPSGVFVVSTPNRAHGTLEDKPRNPYHIREWNSAEFRELLSRYFGEVEFYDQFLYLAKSGLPGSRTIGNLILKTLRPDAVGKMGKWDVTTPSDIALPLVRLIPRYIVAVCRQGRR